ncbi:rhodanese-like domain-containing protein [Lactiplantibacillus plantarum]|uniref:rhodanese-like domain-containing protein n=1 Tax=Lactiplantibacillus plantarum TaxID=1590 RepID=UPI00209D61EF|nr:rhodanese-like domain-containing protein [Lactiplantibacillus plantarum]USZ59469.1 rhodanese-like domain-containing protein [Lactiplantibacillus plantarum]
MNDKKIELLTTYLSLYIDHHTVLADMQNVTGKYVVLDVRNAPAQVKKDQIKGAIAMPAKDLATRISELDPAKTYVVYDWTGGTTLGKTALLVLLSAGFDAYELAGALEGWKGMQLPVEVLAFL